MNDRQKKIISQMLVEIILHAAPGATAVSKYGGVLYTLKPTEKEGQFCGIFAYKNHVQLGLCNGPDLKDPAGVLLGSGTTRRHVNFESPDDVGWKILVPLLKQAASFPKKR